MRWGPPNFTASSRIQMLSILKRLFDHIWTPQPSKQTHKIHHGRPLVRNGAWEADAGNSVSWPSSSFTESVSIPTFLSPSVYFSAFPPSDVPVRVKFPKALGLCARPWYTSTQLSYGSDSTDSWFFSSQFFTIISTWATQMLFLKCSHCPHLSEDLPTLLKSSGRGSASASNKTSPRSWPHSLWSGHHHPELDDSPNRHCTCSSGSTCAIPSPQLSTTGSAHN